MKQKKNEMSWSEIFTRLGLGALMGIAFLTLVCCGDALARLISGQ